MNPSQRTCRGRPRRRGLAPLELVMTLPLLLLVMALTVVIGSAACWKVRGLVIARDSIFGDRWPRDQDFLNQPVNWPAPATWGATGPVDAAVLDHPLLDQPVVRGPLPNIDVNARLLYPGRGMRQGEVNIVRAAPMIAKLKPLQFNIDQPLLDDKFQYRQMGLAYNTQRRIPFIYDLPQGPQNLQADYQQALNAILTAPFRPQLRVLDRDDEIFAYYGNYVDFHPRLSSFCSLDMQLVQTKYVTPLVDRIRGRPASKQPPLSKIDGLPARMAKFFINMYQSQLNDMQNGVIPYDAALAAQLQSNIDVLKAFLNTL